MQINSSTLTHTVQNQTAIGSTSKADAKLGIFCAAFLGVALIWGVGFSHINVFHNAAHDTRHSNAFPCH
ncbi:CbtB-domain containing protein [Dongia soli]|uniref:CbtB-domain containing protein n=1 Tax=Dongia soli TaxID=600628 RepID=A0ABU5EH81_9PROT|nr:CbtB-domain containing protein [Dongia soli]MDY0885793.1 CbtB-domain containing protein [Dongia soli]